MAIGISVEASAKIVCFSAQSRSSLRKAAPADEGGFLDAETRA
jgi:hypothetical protein